MVELLSSGIFTTIQDGGRYGLSHLGISAGGAADPLSFEIGNRLVGNPKGAACFEMTLKGGEFRFTVATVFAVTGSDFSPVLDEKPIPMWETCRAEAGQILKFGMTREGARSYLCHRANDEAFRSLRSAFRTSYPEVAEVRVTRGVDWELFPKVAHEGLVTGEFTVTPQANRAGLRLSGESLLESELPERITEGVSWGVIQVPASGQPIVLMNDQQTTGGYPQIAQVIRADRWILGQAKPGQRFRFRAVEFEEAVQILREQQQRIKNEVGY